jgi:phosphohistidine phosphatase
MAGPWKLYLVRHAVAEERGSSWPDDAARPLTERGMSRFEKGVRGLAELGVTLDIILTSPFLRTRQTAEILAAGFHPHPNIVAVDSLAPGGSHQAVFADLERHSRRSKIAIVGHEPGIGELAARLISARHPIPFKKGAVCRIDVETLAPGQSGSLVWFLTPRALRALRG